MDPKRFGQLLEISNEAPLGGPENYIARDLPPPGIGSRPGMPAGDGDDAAQVANIMRKEQLDPRDPETLYRVAERLGVDPDDDVRLEALQQAIDQVAGELGDAGM